MRVLTITLVLSLGAAATSAEEGGPNYAYCPEDPEVQALIEETIDNIFKYLGDEEMLRRAGDGGRRQGGNALR
jgi:hypothetical protein